MPLVRHGIKRYGWVADTPDQRDPLYAAPVVQLKKLPPKIDPRPQCPKVIYDQGQLFGKKSPSLVKRIISVTVAKRSRRELLLALCLVLTPLAGCSSVPFTPLTPDDFWVNAGFTPAAAKPNPEGLACKMLKASVCTYDIDKLIDRDGSTDGSLPLEAGGNGKPAFCAALPDLYVAKGVIKISPDSSSDHRDAGFIALLSKPGETTLPRNRRSPSSEVVIAFRGTLPPGSEDLDTVVKDWANDANARLVDFKDNDSRRIKVHRGFRNAVENINTDLYKWIGTWQSEGRLASNFRVYITGHSKGGAMAQIAALELRDGKISIAGVYTYAAARAGDTNFAKYYAGIPTSRYENQGDVVPHLPPTAAELAALQVTKDEMFADLNAIGAYTSVGTLAYITDKIRISPPDGNEAALNDFRVTLFRQDARKEMRHFALVRNLAWAHSSAPPPVKPGEPANSHRYWRAVCGETK